MYQDIKERTFNFGLRIISLSGYLPGNNVGYTLGKQILRSGTSIGANVEEGVAAFNRADYAYMMSIALKEARETHYWLRLIEGSELIEKTSLNEMLIENEEIKKILGAIVSKLRGKSKNKQKSEN